MALTRMRFPSTWLVLTLLAAGAIGAEEMNLYDWMGVAPVVVHGEVQGELGRYVEVRVTRVIRGDLEAGRSVLVNLRKVNRNQDVGDPVLKLPPERSFLFLLTPSPPRKKRLSHPRYDILRGIEGARELRAEGSPAVLDAAEALARVQDRKDERRTWASMRAFLEEVNPVLVETALDHHLKFDRGTPELLPLLRPLLDHPRAELREGAALLISEILDRYGSDDLAERSLLVGELAARARADAVVAVRVAATIALASLWDDSTRRLLEEIARDDADQLVRYTAERMLYLKRQQQESSREPLAEQR